MRGLPVLIVEESNTPWGIASQSIYDDQFFSNATKIGTLITDNTDE